MLPLILLGLPGALSDARAADPAALATQGDFQTAAQAEGVGLKIELEVSRDGLTGMVPLHTPVYSGDVVAFRFTPSEAGHITIINRGTSGNYTLLYPANPGEDNTVTPQSPVRFPASGGFEVHGDPGEEGIFVIFSRQPASAADIAELESLMAPAGDADPDSIVALSFRSLTRDLRPAPPPERYTVSDTDELRVSFSLHHEARP
jgi:hypothetical protein